MEKREFMERVCKGVNEKLKEKGFNVQGEIGDVTKNNGIVYSGIQFKGDDLIQPVVYLDGLYKGFEDGGWTIEEAVNQAVGIYVEGRSNVGPDISEITDYEKVKSHLSVEVRNAEWNADLLKDVPHEIHEDLAEMYRIDVEMKDGTHGSVLIRNNLMEHLGVDQATLKKDAWASMKANNPGQLRTMMDTLMELAGNRFGEEAGAEMVEQMGAGKEPMYVYTNQDKIHGAAYMLDKESMSAVAKRLGESFAVLPSSIHECIILPESMTSDYAALKRMVEEVNATQVAPDEILSDNVYRFDKDTQQLSVVQTEPVQMMGIQQM